MRAVDDSTPMYLAVLRLVRTWGPLPESDISHMLKNWLLVTNVYREMEEHGYIDMQFAGDEFVISIAVMGRLFLEQEDESERQKG